MRKTFTCNGETLATSNNRQVYDARTGSYKGYIRNGIFHSENGGTMIDLSGYGVQTMGGSSVGQKFGWSSLDEGKKGKPVSNPTPELDAAANLVVDVAKGLAIVTVGTVVITYEVGKAAGSIAEKLGEKLANVINKGIENGVNKTINWLDTKIAENKAYIHSIHTKALEKGQSGFLIESTFKDNHYYYNAKALETCDKVRVKDGKTGQVTEMRVCKNGNVIDEKSKLVYNLDIAGNVIDKDGKVTGIQIGVSPFIETKEKDVNTQKNNKFNASDFTR